MNEKSIQRFRTALIVSAAMVMTLVAVFITPTAAHQWLVDIRLVGE